MIIKVLIPVLVCLNIRSISGAPDSLRSSKDDADQAFFELSSLYTQLIYAALSNMSDTTVDLETIIIYKAVDYIHTDTEMKINQTKLTISKNLQTLEDFGLDSSVCKGTVFSQLDNFFNKIGSRVDNNCELVAITILQNWLDKTSDKMIGLGASLLSCHSQNIAQCTNYNVDDSCYAGVIDGIEKAKSAISLNYQIMTTAFFTKIADYKLPCQDLLNYEVAHFLSSRLETVRNCVTVQLKLAQQSFCNLS